MRTNNTKQAAWIAAGSLFSFGFSLVSSMILSRYFEKGDYGTYKQVLYVYQTMLTVFTLGLPKAFSYFLPRTPLSQAKSLIRKITNLFFLLGGIFSLFLFVGAGLISDLMNNPDLAFALRIFSVVPFLMLPTMGLEGILATYRKTKFMAFYTVITRSIMLLCVALPVVFFHVGYIGSIIGFVVASLASFLLALYLKYMPVRHQGDDDCNVTFRDIFNFSLPLLLASLWGMLIHSVDQFFISRYFGAETFAEFSNGAIQIPFISMIISSSAAVLTPLLSGKIDNIDHERSVISGLWSSVLTKAMMLIFPMIIFFMADANLIMTTLYGKSYEASGGYFLIKSLVNIAKVVPFYPFMVAFGAVKEYSRSMMWTFLLMVLLEYVSILVIPNPLVLTAIHTICLIGQCVFFIIFIAHSLLNVDVLSLIPWMNMFKVISIGIVCVLFVQITDKFLLSSIHDVLRVCLHILIYGITYLIIGNMFKLNYFAIIKPLVKK
jgi:O-antigen/teichoic acid export membrane protein